MKLRTIVVVAVAALAALSTADCAQAAAARTVPAAPPPIAAPSLPTAAPTDAPDTVRVDTGLLHGSATATVRHFLGVPYAQPPVGRLRWAAPRPAAPWPGVRQATRPGSRCPQTAAGPGQPGSTDEDCLYAAAEILGLLEAERPAFRLQTSDAARAFTAVKLADGDGSAVQALTGGWVA